jgi:hypothetical protein
MPSRKKAANPLRSRALTTLLVFAAGLIGASASASPVPVRYPVRYKEGLIHAFVILSTLDGVPLAQGDVTQVAHGDRVTCQLLLHFKDGSKQEETTVFSQRVDFRVITYHLLQKGPAFKHDTEVTVAVATGQVTVRYTDDDGKEKVETSHLQLPPDLANGIVPTLLKNVPPGTAQIEVPFLVATPKPRLIKLAIHPQGTEPFSVAGSGREAIHYVAKIELGGLAGVLAPLLGKDPPDAHIWIIGGDAPGFLKSETLSYVGGPMWRIELFAPVWPPSPANAKSGDAAKQ